ncbi:1670_t:CDS:2 [Dentiscutata erythropus]|uniref:1670_t:CDS:1 n=1 Tax=Dentiscutata erythropus TaxID=1348616 RepID=A0A9N9C1J1_9GLOM|nr:1670_t:CDS:2 [Dentiscutata erythropus]
MNEAQPIEISKQQHNASTVEAKGTNNVSVVSLLPSTVIENEQKLAPPTAQNPNKKEKQKEQEPKDQLITEEAELVNNNEPADIEQDKTPFYKQVLMNMVYEKYSCEELGSIWSKVIIKYMYEKQNEFEEVRRLIEEVESAMKEELPSFPKRMLQEILNVILFDLPITDRRLTKPTV